MDFGCLLHFPIEFKVHLTKLKWFVSFWDSIGCLTFNEKNINLFKTELNHLFNRDQYILIHLIEFILQDFVNWFLLKIISNVPAVTAQVFSYATHVGSWHENSHNFSSVGCFQSNDLHSIVFRWFSAYLLFNPLPNSQYWSRQYCVRSTTQSHLKR